MTRATDHGWQRRTEKFARPINGMIRLIYKCRIDATHNEYDLARHKTRSIAKRFTALMSVGGISPRKTNAAPIGRTLSQLRRAPPSAAGRKLSVKALLPEDIERYSAYLAPFYESAEAKTATVMALHQIFTSVIDVAFAKSPTDLVIEQRRIKESFQSSVSHASFSSSLDDTAKSRQVSKATKSIKTREFEP